MNEPRQNVGAEWKRLRVGHFRSEADWKRFQDIYREGMKEMPTPRRSEDFRTSFGIVRAYLFGDDPRTPLLLLPGRNSATPLWAGNMSSLGEGRSIWAIDLLGEPGLSVQTARIANAADHAQWLDELIERLGVDTVHLLGISIGGWAAMNLAVRRPNRVASVSFLDSPLVFAALSVKMIIFSIGTILPLMPSAVQKRLLGWISGGARADDLMEGRLVDAGMNTFRSALPVPKQLSDDELAAIDLPVLGIFAGRSIVHDSAKAADNARRLLPNAQVEVWGEASHAISGEYSTGVAERVHTFLNEVESSSRSEECDRENRREEKS
ncbi:alpha/beta fold hydrolase [Rhodococcus sp. NPDC058521]|uniref:alpha/beta fold hydrolase n=1 Tax=Rhodococcus sp. NPDC058521 TaxID=3346536 RepID=UPI003647E097